MKNTLKKLSSLLLASSLFASSFGAPSVWAEAAKIPSRPATKISLALPTAMVAYHRTLAIRVGRGQTPAAGRAPTHTRAPLLNRLRQSVSRGVSAVTRIFDTASRREPALAGFLGTGFRPGRPPLSLPDGRRTDPAPKSPNPRTVPTASFDEFLSGPSWKPGIFDAAPKVLDADPNDQDAIEQALRRLVDLDKAKYGVESNQLVKVHIHREPGRGDQADNIIALFEQEGQIVTASGMAQGVPVDNSQLAFAMKVENGRAVVYATVTNLFKKVKVSPKQAGKTALQDDRLLSKVIAYLGRPPEGGEWNLEAAGHRIIHYRKAWRAVSLYYAQGQPYRIAADRLTGEVFVWDGRQGTDSQDAKSASGRIMGKGVDLETTEESQPLKTSPMPYITINIPADAESSLAGKTVTTDKDGRVKIDTRGEKPIKAWAELSGPSLSIFDRSGTQHVRIEVELIPGEETTAVFNDAGTDVRLTGMVNVWLVHHDIADWVQKNGASNDERVKRAIRAYNNLQDACNAHYTMATINFYDASDECVNTALLISVIRHEDGHNFDDALGGIGRLSEAVGDVVAMFRSGVFILGKGFFKNETPSWVRNEEESNNKQYRGPNQEVHELGEITGAIAVKILKAIERSMGDAAKAVAYTAPLLLHVLLYAKPRTIPQFVNLALIADRDQSGNAPNTPAIIAAAKAHGVTAQTTVTGLVSRLMPVKVKPTVRSLSVDESSPAAEATAKATFTLRAGILVRGQIRNEISKYCDYYKLKYDIKEYRDWLGSDFLISVEGPQSLVQTLVHRLQALN
ncbi:MAG: hypothetical protein HY921_03010 [Elusimicrobia bacterium]|nr:hypothetical protein [Elusimicrobiota bacterium]